MNTIWKKQLFNVSEQFDVPVGSTFVHVGNQADQITVWYTCDTSKPMTPRLLHVVGTGHAIPAGNLRHIGVAAVKHFVFHVFEETL